jgi:hypothetical protein
MLKDLNDIFNSLASFHVCKNTSELYPITGIFSFL